MNKFAKKFVVTMLAAATAFGFMTPTLASAGESGSWAQERREERANNYLYNRDSYRHNYRGTRHVYRHHDNRRYIYRDRRNNDAIALGIIGLGAAAIIGGAIANSNNNPRVIYRQPHTPRNVSGSYEPWSRSWMRYCSNKYRSFNPSTGTYRGYDGRDHFCVVN
ncbi:BA14K family protein [Hoeflea sp.]|uniref:BA14K family protein n=1 Tax=Hoeflea sp. TaxID=1940281 RepID=UPI0019AF8AB6|nr:BA14K family protein [Hoeflea sp.]MBC7281345.1 BA14K family protein [Hoeflea sp.]